MVAKTLVPKTLGASILALLAMTVASTDARAAGPTFGQQTSLPGSTDAFFGYSVAIDGDTAVVGAWNDNGNKGAAYVFVRTGTTWSQQQELTAADGASGDQFGYAVAVSGNTALVGAVGRAANQGYVYAFARTGSAWTQQQELTAADGAPEDCFGCTVAVRGGTALVGAPGKLSGTGAAYAVVNAGGGWQPQQEFLGQAAGEAFGFSVALNPDATTAMVGAYGANNEVGHAYVLTTNGGTWSQQAVLAASDGLAHDRFGYSVAVDTNTALVGAYGHGGRGAAYVFTRSAGAWSQQAPTLLASDGAPNDAFGYSVALSGNTAVVGAYEKSGAFGPGAAYVFTEAGGTWSQQEVLAAGGGQYFGYSVATTGTTAVVGAFGASNDSGAAYVFASGSVSPVPALGDKTALLGLVLLLAGLTSLASPLRGRPSIVKILLLRAMAVALAIGLAACSAEGPDGASGPRESSPSGARGMAAAIDDTGTVGAELTLPAGQQIEVVQWIITGPNNAVTVVQSGSVDVPSTHAVSFVASSIPAGTAYRITLSGTAIDGSVTCTGAASFAITSHMTTRVPVALGCSVVTSGSQVTLVSGQSFNCGNVTNVTAIPFETAVGGTIALAATAAGPVPSALSYAWSAPSGAFDHPNASGATFTCTAPGPVPLTLTVADGPVPAGAACNAVASTRTITVQCDAALQGDGGTDAGGPPPPPVPALPRSGVFLLGLAMLGIGSLGSRRRPRNIR
ncbi:MAG TPA: FG-GAP repeat protein [Polyangiaceae bacterium]|nr:FG-GAP repeat protein [Polyangiaceae bacterium]